MRKKIFKGCLYEDALLSSLEDSSFCFLSAVITCQHMLSDLLTIKLEDC